MSDPAEEFRKLASVVADMRQEVAQALARAAPDYGRDLAHIFTVLQTLEKKAVLRLSPGDLEKSAAEGARQGTANACEALRSAVGSLQAVQYDTGSKIKKIRTLSILWKTAVCFIILLAGIVMGSMISIRLFPNSLMATQVVCTVIGGRYYNRADQPHACIFWES